MSKNYKSLNASLNRVIQKSRSRSNSRSRIDQSLKKNDQNKLITENPVISSLSQVTIRKISGRLKNINKDSNNIASAAKNIENQNESVLIESDSDSTDYEASNLKRSANQKFINTSKSNKQQSNPDVRVNFELVKTDHEKKEWKCKICNKSIKTSYGSDTNLRSHVGWVHNMPDFLTQSQLDRKKKNQSELRIPISEKKILDEMLVDCIIEDARTFNDFLKKGIKKVLLYLKPGYKPPCKKTIMKLV